MAAMSDTKTPAVVLVHGAFADASSWNGLFELLQAKGVQVTAPRTRCAGWGRVFETAS
jgi:alpha-beta hydrolase superfamily lysophospholipase